MIFLNKFKQIRLLMRIHTPNKTLHHFFIFFFLLIITPELLYSQCPTVSNSTQSFCDSQTPKISNLQATDTGGGIRWYANAIGGIALSGTTNLVNGEDYFADSIAGNCAVRSSVTVTIYSAPTGSNFQGVCVSNIAQATPLNPQFNISGNNLKWYTSPTGGTAISNATILTDNGIYYISQTNPDTGCETTRFPLLVLIGLVPTPTGNSVQNFCSSSIPSVAALVASGDNNWYISPDSDVILDLTTPLINGQHYFASTIDAPCESTDRLDVLVNIYDPNDAGNDANEQICLDQISTLPPFDLFDLLGGAPNNTGVWSGPRATSNGFQGTIDVSTLTLLGTPYVFTYTVSNTFCTSDTSTVTVNVTPNLTPTFTQVGPICSGDALAALPTTSNNGITGTWSPAVDNLATTPYTFTPTAGQCATTATMTITVTPNVTPTFTQVGPICSGATLSALPTTSNNGITGTWSPAVDNLATTPYTFTPTAGQCATTATMTITVTPNVTPTFTQVGPICSGATLSALPTTSNNGITGTWSPAVNNLATTPYTFTPTAGQCVTTTTVTMTITVNLIPNTPVLISNGDYFCSLPSPTIAELSNNINGTPTMVWYDSPIGGSIYNNTDLLIDGQTYYGSSLSIDGCESNRTAVTVSVCSDVVIPDGFSPNNDEINEFFEIVNLGILFPNFKLEIFNRYGNLVFTGSASNPKWDGKTSGGGINLGENILPVGVDFYILDFKNNTRKPIQGRLYLSR